MALPGVEPITAVPSALTQANSTVSMIDGGDSFAVAVLADNLTVVSWGRPPFDAGGNLTGACVRVRAAPVHRRWPTPSLQHLATCPCPCRAL